MLLVLSVVPILEQQFNELVNGKSQTYRDQKSKIYFYFYNNIINIEEFHLIQAY